jgi:ABC-type uncharacterized transport system permease subunit
MTRVHFLERRLEPSESALVTTGAMLLAILAALVIGGFLLLPFGANALQAYRAMGIESFGSLRGIGNTLVVATPLIFIGLGTTLAWRSGFFYLGFEGTLLIGASTAVWVALLTRPGALLGPLPPLAFFPLVFLASFIAGGAWSGIVGLIRARFGGNEVIISLMMNYIAVFLVNYLVSYPLRAPGDLPQTAHIPDSTMLPFVIPDTRAHAGILAAVAAALLVWVILRKTPLGFELLVSGLNARAARYGGINVARRLVLAAFLAGGVGAWAGLSEVLGVQFRLMDGISQGTGFIGIAAALLGKLHPAGVVLASILYAGMEVGADAMQRRAGLPSSVISTVQALIVLLVLASDMLRYYRVDFSALRVRNRRAPEAAAVTSTEGKEQS